MNKSNKTSRLSILFLMFAMAALITSCEKKVELQKFSSKYGRFSVMAPGTFKKNKRTIDTEVGQVNMIHFMIEEPEVVYLVAYIDYPPGVLENSDPDVMLANGRNEMLKKINGKLISEERIAYDKDPGVEIHYTAKGETLIGHTVIILSGNRLYQAGALGDKGNFPVDAAKQYVDSFEIW